MAVIIDREFIPYVPPEPAPTPTWVDDSTTSDESTWSSSKINTSIEALEPVTITYTTENLPSGITWADILTKVNAGCDFYISVNLVSLGGYSLKTQRALCYSNDGNSGFIFRAYDSNHVEHIIKAAKTNGKLSLADPA